MGWKDAIKRPKPVIVPKPVITPYEVDWKNLISLDFETYYDEEYTLKKLSTSEYIRDKRFKAQMVGIKRGKGVTRWFPAARIEAELARIDWNKSSLLAHHAQFDAFILSQWFGIKPKFIFCTMSMARALYANDIGASLDETAQYLGKGSKLEGILEQTKGVRDWNAELNKLTGTYVVQDVDLMADIFIDMLPRMPSDEMELIDLTVKMFTDPVLMLDIPRVKAEIEREKTHKLELLERIGATRAEVGSNEKYAGMLEAAGIVPPVKLSPTAKKRGEIKQIYAFSRTDQAFMNLKAHPNQRVRDLIECRLEVKSTASLSRAQRLLLAGQRGKRLPVYLKYAAAHTHRWGGGDKLNFQSFERGSELRKSIIAPAGYVIPVSDSKQIEARMNAWMADQIDLLDEFRAYDEGKDRDPYCKQADLIYGREIRADTDPVERFVGKVSVLMLGYQAGAPRFQTTLGLGTMGPPVFIEPNEAATAVNAYRLKNAKIVQFWNRCSQIISHMYNGRRDSYKCISWDRNVIYLPNGMELRYPNLRLVVNPDSEWEEWAYDRKNEQSKLYGGLLCENIIQALSRIAIAEQFLKIAKHYRVVMMTHDELAMLCKTREKQACLKFAESVMSTSPIWAPDLPLSVESKCEKYYSK